MKLLITGSEGNLMQAVIPRLLDQGHDIVGVDNLYRHGTQSPLANKDYPLITQDLTDRGAVKDLCCGVDVVFLAAAKLYGVGGFNHYCADILADDVTIQANMLQSAVQHQVGSVVYISSSMVYENCEHKDDALYEHWLKEARAPLTEYGLSKFVGERMCEAFHKQYGLDYVIWRPFNVVNPGEKAMKQQGFSHVIADYITNIVIKKMNPLPIIGSGQQIRCFTWIHDVARVIADHSFDPRALNQAFNIANPTPINMRDLARKIHDLTGARDVLEFETVQDYANDVQTRIPSIQKLIDTFGTQQWLDLESMLEIYIARLLES